MLIEEPKTILTCRFPRVALRLTLTIDSARRWI